MRANRLCLVTKAVKKVGFLRFALQFYLNFPYVSRTSLSLKSGVVILSLGITFLPETLLCIFTTSLGRTLNRCQKRVSPVCVPALDSFSVSCQFSVVYHKSPLCRVKPPRQAVDLPPEIQNIETTSSHPKPFWNSLSISSLRQPKTRRSQLVPPVQLCQGRSNQAVPQTVQEPTAKSFKVPVQTLASTQVELAAVSFDQAHCCQVAALHRLLHTIRRLHRKFPYGPDH